METVVDLEIPDTQSVLVLNTTLETDKPVQVLISNSVNSFSQSLPMCIADAELLFYENDDFIDTLKLNSDSLINYYVYSNGNIDSIPMNFYELDYTPQKDTYYKIEAKHSNYPSVFARTYIPNDVDIEYEIDLSNEDLIGLELSFDDNVSQDNYYRLKLYSSCSKEWENEEGELEIYYWDGFVEMLSNDPSFPSGIPWEGYTFSGNQVVFSDALFNGMHKDIRIDIESGGYSYVDCDTVRVQFSVFSSDTYLYYNSLEEHRENGPASIFGGEVVPVYSNIENGLGSIISINAQEIQIKP